MIRAFRKFTWLLEVGLGVAAACATMTSAADPAPPAARGALASSQSQDAENRPVSDALLQIGA